MTINRFEDALAGAGGAYEPQRSFQWMLKIEGLDSDDSEVLELSIKTGALPTENNEAVEIQYLNASVFVAGRYTVEVGSFTFNDYLDKNTAKRIIKWRKQVYDPVTHKVGYAKNYKKSAQLIMYGPDYTVERIWLLKGIWPQQATFGTLDMANSEVVEISLELQFDRAIPDKGLI